MKKKIISLMLVTIIIAAISLNKFTDIYASYDNWASLEELDLTPNNGEGHHSLKDVKTYGENYTNNAPDIYSGNSQFFDDIKLNATSRITYGRKIKVNSGQDITIVASKNDTENSGGLSINSGLAFYWSIAEYDSNGYIVYDGGWRQAKDKWTIGKSNNNDSGYGLDGYPKNVTQSKREASVRYIVPIFRWNNGDETMGSGSNLNLEPDKLAKAFPIFSIITDPFNYTFNCNGGTSHIGNEDKGSYTLERLGTSSIDVNNLVEPTRPGYNFAGWKIVGGTGKQSGKVYSNSELRTMMSDGKYWSSLFENATFEAQWELNSYPLKLDANYCGVWFDKLKGNDYDLGSVDLYVNGNLEAENITDWEKTYPYGTVYEFKNLKSKNGYILTDAGSLKGTITADTTATVYVYDKAGLAYFDKNSADGGTGNDTFVYYSMVSLAYDKGAVMGNDSVGFGNKFNKSFMYWKTDKNNYYNSGDIMPVSDNYQGKAYIKSAGSSLVMDIAWGGSVNESGLNIQLADAWGGNGEYWSFIHADGDDYFIVNSALGKYVTADTASMDVKYCNLDWSSSQMWTLSVAGDGCYYITSKANPNLRITAQGTVANSNIGLGWKSDSNAKQKWKILFDNRDSVFTAQWGAALQQKVKVSVIARYEGIEAGTYAKEETVINRREYTVGTPVTWVRDKDDTYEDASFSELASKDATYYVTVKRKTHTVALNKQTGISGVAGNGMYRHGKNITINASVAAGYRFTGWTDSNGKNISSTSSSQLTVTDDVTLTANAETIDYTITYDLAGGTLDGKTNPERYNVETQTFTLNNPKRPGYIFAGWTGTGLNTADKTVTINQGSTGNRSYTANWIVGTSHLQTFAGTGISSTNYASGAYITVGKDVTVEADVKNGYLFTNWTDSSGNVVSSDKDYSFAMPVDNVNLTANAVPISYNIVFNSNKPSSATGNVTGNTAAMNNVKYDTAVTLTQNDYSLNGWNFTGWNTKTDGSGTGYADKASVKNLSSTDGATVTLYAQWVQGEGYAVTAVAGKGIQGTTGSGTYKDGDKVNIGITGVKKGYTWKENEITTGWFMSNDKVTAQQGYSFTMTQGNRTYTANATPNTYKVVYNKNKSDATGTIADSTYTYDVTGTLRVNKFTANGYKQTGWNTKSDGTGTHYDAGKAVEVLNWTDTDNGVINLYAEWTTNSYPVTVKVQYENVDGSFTNPETVINHNYNYGDIVTWNRDEDAAYKKVTYSKQVTGAINDVIKVYRQRYHQNLYVQYENADGSFSAAQKVIDNDYLYGDKITWSRAADKAYKAASISWNVDGIHEQTLKIYRNVYHIDVVADKHINKVSGSGDYRYESTAVITADVEIGYHFVGWNKQISNNPYAFTVTDNAAYTAYADPNTDTKYVVRHWKQKLYLDNTQQYADGSKHDIDNYFLAATDNLTGTTDTEVTPATKSYEGFTSPAAQKVTIKGDGSLVVDYYYTRNKYKINDDDKDSGSDDGNSDADSDKGNGIKDITGGGEYYYEEVVSMEAIVKNGYHWHIDDDCHTDKTQYPTGWKVTKPGCGIDKFLDDTGYGSQKIKFVMPAHDVYVKADATNNSYTISFNANGGTGSMQEVNATYDVALTLPDNGYTRTTEFGTSKFLYWEDKKNDTTYINNDTVKSLTDEFNGAVTLYASWDDCPEITAQERWFTVDDAQNNKITLEELLSTAKVTDDRDADIADKLTVKYYHPNNFNQFNTDGYIMVTYTATDSSDNTTEVTVKVNIVDTVAVEQEKNTYVRFIGPDYYQETFENGGLEDDSVWKKNPEYAETLERAMENRRSMTYSYNEVAGWFGMTLRVRKAACDTRDHLVEKWVFTHEDVLAAKEYINEHGIGNMKEPDALSNFRVQFAHCKQ